MRRLRNFSSLDSASATIPSMKEAGVCRGSGLTFRVCGRFSRRRRRLSSPIALSQATLAPGRNRARKPALSRAMSVVRKRSTTSRMAASSAGDIRAWGASVDEVTGSPATADREATANSAGSRRRASGGRDGFIGAFRWAVAGITRGRRDPGEGRGAGLRRTGSRVRRTGDGCGHGCGPAGHARGNRLRSRLRRGIACQFRCAGTRVEGREGRGWTSSNCSSRWRSSSMK